jgi:hypothetical protein
MGLELAPSGATIRCRSLPFVLVCLVFGLVYEVFGDFTEQACRLLHPTRIAVRSHYFSCRGSIPQERVAYRSLFALKPEVLS